MQANLDLRLDLHNPLILPAWCILNVQGLGESHPQSCEEISKSVTQHLYEAGHITENTQDAGSKTFQAEDEYFETKTARKKRAKEQKWHNRVAESTDSIADRFPYK